MEVKIAWKLTTKLISLGMIILLTFIIVSFGISIYSTYSIENSMQGTFVLWMSIAVMVSVLVVPVLFFPIKYVLADSQVIIKRFANDSVIPHAEIQDVYRLRDKSKSMLIRTFGVGGYLGFYGKFYASDIGTINLMAGNTSDIVIIETVNGVKYGLSDTEDGIIYNQLNQRLQKKS